jgi:hypothetical protein
VEALFFLSASFSRRARPCACLSGSAAHCARRFSDCEARDLFKLEQKVSGQGNIHTTDLSSQLLGQFWPSVDLAHNVSLGREVSQKSCEQDGSRSFGSNFPASPPLRTDGQHPTCTLQLHPWRVYSTSPHTKWVAST